ncbi:hypothetical protein GGI15_002070 [Coemansia interrupta]|uniref:F-box domain-containing protein n=1 Tax=Coemansia interrupta TaxID=1126814 RepID=A0A9W8HLM6_9FUNG|nr:hypothetical protein GGI15_002070 [Coemansia interrupta]
MYHHRDEGFDDYPLAAASILTPPQSTSTPISKKIAASTPPGRLVIADTERRALESLAHTLRTSTTPQSCTQLAIMLLSHVPADMLKVAMQQLDLLLRRDFIGMLPTEIATQILEYLEVEDIARNVLLVNRQWYEIATQPCVWRRLFHRRGWKVDRSRWEFYYALPPKVTPTRILLDSAVFQVSRAMAVSANLLASPALSGGLATNGHESRGGAETATAAALLAQQRSTLDANAIQAMLLDASRQAARKPRRMLYSLLDLQRQTAKNDTMLSEKTELDAGASQQSYCQQMFQRQQCLKTKASRIPTAATTTGMVDMSSPSSSSESSPSSYSPSPSSSPLLSSPVLPWHSPQNVHNAKARYCHPHSTQSKRRPWEAKPVNWRRIYSEYYRLLGNWRDGRCRVDRWESAHTESIYALQFDRRNRLFTGSRDHSVKVWHLSETGSQITPLATLRGHSGSVLTLQAEGGTLITGSSDTDACVWSTETYTIVQRLSHPDAVLSLRFNDRWLATACKDGIIRVWKRKHDAFGGPFELVGHGVAINAIHLHDDILVSASGDRTVRVWNLETRTCTKTLSAHTRGVACLDFDGKYIVSGSSDRSLRVWNIETGECERTIGSAHSDLVRTVMFDRRMDIMVSGSYDESIKIWRFSTGELIHKIRNVHTSRVFKLMFDRTRIVSCSHDRSISIIDFSAELPHARLLV